MAISITTKQKFTVPAFAKRLGVSPTKVAAWIRAGELKAMNAATRPGGRPRYLIDESDIRDFEARREIVPKPEQPRHLKRAKDYTEYV